MYQFAKSSSLLLANRGVTAFLAVAFLTTPTVSRAEDGETGIKQEGHELKPPPPTKKAEAK